MSLTGGAAELEREQEEEPERSALSVLLSRPGLALQHLIRTLDFDPLRSWYYFALARQWRLSRRAWAPFGSYFEFGVGAGGTLSKFLRALKAFGKDFGYDPKEHIVVGFDTFSGLPDPLSAKDLNPRWIRGKFAHSMSEIERLIERNGFDPESGRFRMVEGQFGLTLTDSLRQDLARTPPAIVTVDVDYYSSTVKVLSWIEPILPSGCLLYFDDIWDFHGHPEMGELAAITEFNQRGDRKLIPFPNLGSTQLSGQTFLFARRDLHNHFPSTSQQIASSRVES